MANMISSQEYCKHCHKYTVHATEIFDPESKLVCTVCGNNWERVSKLKHSVKRRGTHVDQEFRVGDIVHFKPVTHDEFDRPVDDEPPATLTIVRVFSDDYEVVSSSTGNHFYVKLDELLEGNN